MHTLRFTVAGHTAGCTELNIHNTVQHRTRLKQRPLEQPRAQALDNSAGCLHPAAAGYDWTRLQQLEPLTPAVSYDPG